MRRNNDGSWANVEEEDEEEEEEEEEKDDVLKRVQTLHVAGDNVSVSASVSVSVSVSVSHCHSLLRARSLVLSLC